MEALLEREGKQQIRRCGQVGGGPCPLDVATSYLAHARRVVIICGAGIPPRAASRLAQEARLYDMISEIESSLPDPTLPFDKSWFADDPSAFYRHFVWPEPASVTTAKYTASLTHRFFCTPKAEKASARLHTEHRRTRTARRPIAKTARRIPRHVFHSTVHLMWQDAGHCCG